MRQGLTPRTCTPAGELLASTAAQQPPPGASTAVASSELRCASGAYSASIDSLTTRIMGAQQAAAGAAAAAPAQQAGYPLSYVVSWAVDAPAGSRGAVQLQQGAGAAPEVALAVAAPRQEPLLLSWPAGGQQGAAGAAAAGLAALQQVAGLASAGGVVVQAELQGAGLVEQPLLLGPSAGGDAAGAAAAAASCWGLLRTAASEAPGSSFRLLDCDTGTGTGTAATALPYGPGPPSPGVLDAAAQRAGALLSQGLAAAELEEAPEWVQVRPEPRSSLANLVARGADLAELAPGQGEVLVNVKAVGVNFRDVLNVLGAQFCR